MVEILRGIGDVTIVEVAVQGMEHREWTEDIRRIRIQVPKQVGRLARYLHSWSASLRVALQVRPSAVVAENFVVSFPGWLSAKLCGSVQRYDADDLIIPDTELTMTKRDLFWYKLQQWTIRRAHLVIAANEERARFMAEHYQLKQVPTIMRNIPARNGRGPEDCNMVKRFLMPARCSVDEVFVIYQKDALLMHGIGRFVEAMRYLPSNFRLVVAGDGPDLNRLKEQSKALEQNGRFASLGRVPHRLLPAIIRLADVGITTHPFKGLNNNIYCSPNKIFGYAHAGLPVVATDQPPLRKWIERYGIGGLVREYDSPEQVARMIQQVVENKSKYAKALLRFLEGNRWENKTERVHKAIDCILTESRRAT
jgi:glycosyltransferase involved in cell wall biosynthesis